MNDWGAAQIARLSELWDTGMPASQIAARMGISKNSVIGKCHRLKLLPRPSPIHWGAGGVPVRKRPRPLPAPRVTLPSLAALGTLHVPTRSLALRGAPSKRPPTAHKPKQKLVPATTRTCQYIFGTDDKRTWRKCGEPVDATWPGCPYCRPHKLRCWTTRTRPEAA